MARLEGLAAGLNVLSESLLEKERRRRKFRDRMKEVLFDREIKSGRIEPITKITPQGGFRIDGMRRVPAEERLNRQIESVQKMQQTLQGSQGGKGLLQGQNLQPKVNVNFDQFGNATPKFSLGSSSVKERGGLTQSQALTLLQKSPEILEDPFKGDLVAKALGTTRQALIENRDSLIPEQGPGLLDRIKNFGSGLLFGGRGSADLPGPSVDAAPSPSINDLKEGQEVVNSKGQKGKVVVDASGNKRIELNE